MRSNHRSSVLAIALCACGGGHPPGPGATPIANPASPPRVELVVADIDETQETPHMRVRFARTTPAGLAVTRTVSVPGIVVALAWIGRDPVVMLESSEVGQISATGYQRFPAVPAARWTIPKPGPGSPDSPTERFEAPRWRLIVAPTGDVWQARCDWGWDLPHGIAHHCVPEGGRCDAWVHAHVWPGPMAISHDEPPVAFDSAVPPSYAPIPTASPGTTIRAEIVEVAIHDDSVATPDDSSRRSVVRCTEAGTTIQYPTDDDRDLRDGSGDGVSDLTWLSTTPPMFAVTRRVGCLETEPVVFEGCKQSDVYTGALIAGGPNDTLVLRTGATLLLRWHDQDLGALEGVSLFAFAPSAR
jgi:hypothetical protein